jgi:hypothetical protein
MLPNEASGAAISLLPILIGEIKHQEPILDGHTYQAAVRSFAAL